MTSTFRHANPTSDHPQHPLHPAKMPSVDTAAILFLRIALGCTFLSAVADRFGIWGAPGQHNVAWGNWAHFVAYTAQVNRFLPAAIAPFLAGFATALEILFGVGALIGFHPRLVAAGSAVLLLSFAMAMASSFGLKSPLDASVFVDAAAAFLWFVMEDRKHRS
ncbi:MAG: DoxX family membrane protein [Acidobacteriaceae bacterium]